MKNTPENKSSVQLENYYTRLGNVILWKNPRGKFKTEYGGFVKMGCGPNGASDYLGFKRVVITQKMVGKTVAIFTALENKRWDGKGRTTPEQIDFIELIKNQGGYAAIINSLEDAKRLLE